jgi:phage host-nuclease inhibitor protein Gam
MNYKEWEKTADLITGEIAWNAAISHIRAQVKVRFYLNRISLRNLITRGRYEEDKAILSIIERAGEDI